MKFQSTNLTISNTIPSIHEHANLILEKAKSISKKLGVIEDGFYKSHTTMTNYLYVNTPIHKMVNVVVTYDVFYFLDDFFGEDTNSGKLPDLKNILDIWTGKKSHVISNNNKIDILYKSIKFISSSIKNDSPQYFFSKYTKSVINHLSFSLKKTPYKTVNEYITIRLYTCGMYPVINLIEYTHSIYLNSKILNEVPSIKKSCKLCALIGGLSNDIFSYAKEKHSDYNLINAYLVTKEAIDYLEAVEKSIIRVNNLHADFQSTIKITNQETMKLNPKDKSIVLEYINALEIIVSSSYHWQISTNRYKHPENVFEDMKA